MSMMTARLEKLICLQKLNTYEINGVEKDGIW